MGRAMLYRLGILSLLATVLLSGCATSSQQPQSGSESAAPAKASTERKWIVISEGRLLDSLVDFGRTDNEAQELVHAGLTIQNQVTLQTQGWMAAELPSIEKGTWKPFPDGTMETIYRLRPGVKWHDGTPLSTKDYVFGREVNLDRQVPFRSRRQVSLMDRVETPDDQTLVITWKQTYPFADALIRQHFFALPRHILEPLYRSGEYERFVNNLYWSREYVGTGPYKVLEFEPGVVMELEAFDDYFLGRPRIDRITVKIIPDTNALLANVLANEIDMTMRDGLNIETGIVARNEWEARGHGQVIFTPVQWSWIGLSPDNPWFDDVRVRRALLHAINRDEISQALTHGLEPVVHFPMSHRRLQFQRADAVATKYPFDPQRALALLEEAGWRRGPEGILLNRNGERFAVDARAEVSELETVQVQAATANYWRAVGLEVNINNLTSRQMQAEENRNRWPGAIWQARNAVIEEWTDRYGNANIPTEANRWEGRNLARWTSPEKEAILQEMDRTLDKRRWEDLSVQFIRVFTVELPYLPLTGGVEVTTFKSRLVGVGPRYESGNPNSRTWNVHEWDLR